jgi:hypothetical protein
MRRSARRVLNGRRHCGNYFWIVMGEFAVEVGSGRNGQMTAWQFSQALLPMMAVQAHITAWRWRRE